MPNQARPDLVQKAICAGVFTGDVLFADNAYRCLEDDPGMRGFTPVGIKQLLRDFICNHGGAIDPRNQGFEHWLDKENPYYYRVVIPVPEFPKGLFVEIIITDYDPNDPFVSIVSVHEQKS